MYRVAQIERSIRLVRRNSHNSVNTETTFESRKMTTIIETIAKYWEILLRSFVYIEIFCWHFIQCFKIFIQTDWVWITFWRCNSKRKISIINKKRVRSWYNQSFNKIFCHLKLNQSNTGCAKRKFHSVKGAARW